MKTVLVLGLVFLLAGQGEARGGGRTSGSESSSSRDIYSNNYDYGYEDRGYNSYSYDYGSDYGSSRFPEWVIPLAAFLVITACCCCCCCFGENSRRVGIKDSRSESQGFSRTLSYEGTTPCYLCLDKVANSDWDSGEHRRRCAFNNQRELLSFPQPYDAYCPNCSERLRLWPAKGHPFYCDECPYERDVLKRSTGENRLNCFLCDFDCCVNCSNAGRFQRARSVSRRPSDTSYRMYDEGINRMGSGQPYYPVDPNQGSYSTPFMNPQQVFPQVYTNTNTYPQPSHTEFLPSAPPTLNPNQ